MSNLVYLCFFFAAEAVEKAHEALKRFDKTLTQEFKVLEVLLEIFTVKEKLDVEPTIIAQ